MIRTVVKDLPTDVRGFTLADQEGDYTIYLNARQSYEINRQTYRHELRHIQGDDFHRQESANTIEAGRHGE